MIKYILRRLLIMPVITFLVTSILFLLVLQLPVERRAQVYMPSGRGNKTVEEYQRVLNAVIKQRGLDKPYPVQYANWLRDLLRGDWGYSPAWRQPVLEGLQQRAPGSIELMTFALLPSIVLAMILGGLSARHQNRVLDYLVRAAAFVAWSLPTFILALILINIFYARLDWFPVERMSTWATFAVRSDDFHSFTGLYTLDALLNGNWKMVEDAVRHLVLPGLTLALLQWALMARVMRSSMLEELRQDYIVTARAKGLSDSKVADLHARRNAILPLISTAGVATSMLISSVIVVEVIFNFNGVGRWALMAVLQADLPVAVGFALVSCLATMLMSLVADILYAVADPRVRLY